ncbi:MAG: glycosyltransferase family 2 protein [Chloroflexota bacterium]
MPNLSPGKVDVSVIIPVLNEEDNLERLYVRLCQALGSLGKTCEIVFVDDGSTDKSFDVLKKLHEQDNRVRVIRFRRNFGQTAAFAAGFDAAQGEIVVTLDADLQNDPADIPAILEKMEEGYDLVSGWRVHRQDPFFSRRLPSVVANRLISQMTGVGLHDYGCSLKAYRREVVKNIRLYGELHRFIPALANWMGVRVGEAPVNHFPRKHGRSKYGLNRTLRVVLDLLTVKFLLDYATRPIQIFGLLGAVCLFTGTGLGAYLSATKIFLGEALADRPLLLLAVLLLVLGVQFITMGLLGELVVRTYHEAQNKPIYVIRERLDSITRSASEGGSENIAPLQAREWSGGGR